LITKAKTDDTNNRRVVFSYLQSKEAIKELFGIVAEKVANRPGGYTRIIKLNNRLGDNAEMCMMELVDFNETMLSAATEVVAKTRRSRRGGAAKQEGTVEAAAAPVAVAEEPSAAVVEDETPAAPATEESSEEEKSAE
jgi:large subunit ribosomal protein L17